MQRIFFPSLKPRFINKEKILEDIEKEAKKIAETDNRIQSIYLFGSYAQGIPSFRSDADLLIVLKEDNRRMIDRIDEFLLKFSNCPIPVDIWVYTEKEIEKAISSGNSFIKIAYGGIKLI